MYYWVGWGEVWVWAGSNEGRCLGEGWVAGCLCMPVRLGSFDSELRGVRGTWVVLFVKALVLSGSFACLLGVVCGVARLVRRGAKSTQAPNTVGGGSKLHVPQVVRVLSHPVQRLHAYLRACVLCCDAMRG